MQESLYDIVQRQKVFSYRPMGSVETQEHSSAQSETSLGDSMLLQKTIEVADRSAVDLAEGFQGLVQSEEVGVSVIDTLDEQRGSLIRVQDNVHNANSTAVQAKLALRQMACRALYNKLLLSLIIVVLIIVACLVFYIKFLRN